ncbi:MAG: universal stress protein [Miltoncostaeaceae bacterium]
MPLSRIVAAVDGTRAGFAAARQAGRLVSQGGTVRLIAVADPYFAAMNTWAGQRLVSPEDIVTGNGDHLAKERLLERAAEAVAAGRRQIPAGVDVQGEVIEGATRDVLLEASKDARVLVLGSHGGGRMTGLVLSSTATDMIRHAACSVLVARPPFDEDDFPRSIAVAVDGSEASLYALEVARQIEVQCGGRPTLRVLTAGRVPSGAVAPGPLGDIPVEQLRGRAHDALARAGEGVDLIVLGARGLKGAKALGSVSERVAHKAASSVLVVRPHA